MSNIKSLPFRQAFLRHHKLCVGTRQLPLAVPLLPPRPVFLPEPGHVTFPTHPLPQGNVIPVPRSSLPQRLSLISLLLSHGYVFLFRPELLVRHLPL
ncbi:hypothetical protein Gmet_3582 [Geobacter metallireducens GS-15]|uniref:Uncharacterized protein n=2 Tax=Geobacter metallireducens TaxID=28232 RepID=J9JEM2_GEOMG|nr:hypothetical protein Gmet_3582 [Geobacter metallireducens GS-15]